MTDIVVPRVVPSMPAPPLTTDPPQIFDDKAIAMAAGYAPTIGGMNNTAADTYQNAVAVSEFAAAMQILWGQVRDGVITIQDALAAIQAGPVVSVMGRSGVVTGLVETSIGAVRDKTQLMANAPLGQPCAYSSTTGAGSDWPTTHTSSWWNVLTIGASTRITQRASQVFAGAHQGWVFERVCQDGTWSAWRRVFTDGSLLEAWVVQQPSGGTCTCDPSLGTMQIVGLLANTTVTLPTPRSIGDQMTMRVFQYSSYSLAFSSNVKMALGAALPSIPSNRWLTLTFCTDNNAVDWHAFVAGIH
ncbi:hypothetical protein [Diaphorobacter caeni]|uniref:hypothetical protein n=1 Tax=Diaphorobacter caeni TaxID=2784387 RepID=UPI0018903D88|nr:hypothetical protein [Diaphorobacter caeni]MBF5006014.1 hypothetical protein [Diaphorobacter caeni]